MIPLDKCLNYHAENFGINIESICIFNATDAVSIQIYSVSITLTMVLSMVLLLQEFSLVEFS